MSRTWEQMSELEQLQCTYSDAYKDAYGFRPRGVVSTDVEWYRTQLADIGDIITWNEQAKYEAETRAIEKLEIQIAAIIATGAKDRATAIRWIMDSIDANGDPDYACYKLGVPYNYFNEVA